MKFMTVKTSTMTAAGLVLMACLALTGRADTWVLANGDRLTGELVGETPAYIEVQHPQLGRLKLPRTALQAPVAANPGGKGATKPPAAKEVPAGLKPEVENWKRQLDVGYSQQSGAKERQDLSVRVQVDGKEGANTFRGTARLLQSDTDGVTVTARREGDFRWRYDINKRLFAQTLTTYAADEVRQIDLSLEQQLGGGYRVIDGARHKANVGLGAVVQYLERVSTEAQTALLASFFQDYAYQLNSRLKLMQESSFMFSDTGTLSVKSGLVNAPSEGSYRLKFISGLQSKVTDRMSLNVRFEYDYDRSILDATLRADQRLTTSLGYIW
jgi:putative salt-induced outer membrane protein YdiY